MIRATYRLQPSEIELIAEYGKRISASRIARLLGVHVTTITYALKKLEMRAVGRPGRPRKQRQRPRGKPRRAG